MKKIDGENKKEKRKIPMKRYLYDLVPLFEEQDREEEEEKARKAKDKNHDKKSNA
jgi:hypothetical protein|tara:strand:+ start:1226 stop:1390 length:165 start_codon:yes stop_codon:yes gene_type:complete